ncbi:Asp-tRNA(Asn)/Glu-tRNA(Gln) amidotransferase subunit GatB [Ruminococcaceae bacterium OttesenSCG-928-N02]|nr:Asp-tRNA(Asn)/Glu-tRNA(Gln) amidotransferase subunit GatB [Ruminococcaceae bacterium OttesenSCG-928-N02]
MSLEKYEIVIGLEIHAELSTKTKIFCECKNEFGAAPNTNVCPICMGMPGTLPVLNAQVADYAIKMGHALDCTINRITKFDRKNYFYPDLPKAYQISQFDIPICANGHLDILVDDQIRRIGVTRIHMEEDAGKLLHDDAFEGALADFNRACVPLIEIVSEPDMRSALEAKTYMEGIHAILLYLGISDAKMQEGSLRADVNVSLRLKGAKEFGTRTEMKNVNSFGAVYRAIQYESNRQMEILEAGGKIEQQTRHWDDIAGESRVLRSKEDAQDYRYFPDPDLLTFEVSEERVAQLKAEIPELPFTKMQRYVNEYKMPKTDAELIAANQKRANFLDEVVALKRCDAKNVSNWLLGDISRILNAEQTEIDQTALTAENLADMIALIEKGTISSNAGKTIIEIIMKEDKKPAEIVQEKGLAQISDTSALNTIVAEVLAANEKAVADYKAGKTNVVGFLVGQCMKKSQGKGNPAILNEMIVAAIEQA